jgi:hypothetical protein
MFVINYLSRVFPRSMETQVPVTTKLLAVSFRFYYHKDTDVTQWFGRSASQSWEGGGHGITESEKRSEVWS